MIKLVISGEPVPQGRPRFARRGSFTTAYDPKTSKDYKAHVAEEAGRQYQGPPVAGAIACDVKVYRPIQKAGSKAVRAAKAGGLIRPTVKGDIDNYFKAITDPLTGLVWVDDAQIVDAHISKFYSVDPHVEISITQLEEES
ncbi:RusA family crossover junction endodeoxyribonuclease [Lacticaseibacillus absianus]|uniref:RusA family crossover junction endodeoxyribonuclease n=1 Tax=Lacticaseibacillus absianus TaxID=2729623 RepID=UPI0015CA9A12|nr:RusA family crossover junction endodeoxyribonuclease [Lacticaseibacillus absianus]